MNKERKKCKKILFISPEYPSETGFGGIGTYVYEMAKAIKAVKGEQVSVTVFSISFNKGQIYTENGVEVVRLLVSKNYLNSYIRITRWLLKHYQEFDVIEDEVFSGYSFFAKFILGNKYKYIARLHGTSHEVYVLERNFNWVKYFKNCLTNFMEKYVTRKADLILVSSSLIGIYSFFLWNIDFQRLNILPFLCEDHLNKFGFKEEDDKKAEKKKYFLFVGRIQKKKGSVMLKKIIERVLDEYPDYFFLVVGTDMEGLMNFFKDNRRVVYRGFIADRDELFSVIRDAKLVIFPSLFESFLLVALESIMCGTPILISRNCGITEYITTFPDYDNIVQSVNNIEEYMNKIRLIISNYEKSLEGTVKQKIFLLDKLSPKKIVNKYFNYLEIICS